MAGSGGSSSCWREAQAQPLIRAPGEGGARREVKTGAADWEVSCLTRQPSSNHHPASHHHPAPTRIGHGKNTAIDHIARITLQEITLLLQRQHHSRIEDLITLDSTSAQDIVEFR